jgi:uncharacterized protein (UPF0332 family)
MDADSLAYLTRSLESLDGAESEYAAGRYNNCTSRAYYAMFQAAIAALLTTGIRPTRADRPWEHDFVQARFAGALVKRRKLYPAELAPMLAYVLDKRLMADYAVGGVGPHTGERVLKMARVFVRTIERRLT